MTGGHSYSLTVRTENHVPSDVLVEHLAVALRDFKFLGKYNITVDRQTHPEADMTRNHPFEGPEVFDDEPKPKYADGGYVPGTHGEGRFAAYLAPKETVLTKAQVEALSNATLADFAEIAIKKAIDVESSRSDDGQLNVTLSVVDPYPLVAEAAFQLREARRRDG